jgi:hypothetical protein
MSTANHIIILQNGLNGHHLRMNPMAAPLREALCGTEYAVIVSDVNNLHLTWSGIQPCGERLRTFVKEQCRLHQHATKISFVGHSLGGLMIRHCIGLLQEENFFGCDRSLQQMQAMMYVSVASPHLGVQDLGAIRQALARHVIRATGSELLLEDEGKLLLNMSLPDSKFMMGLKLFQLYAYGNLVDDFLVPLETACLCDGSARFYAADSDSSAAAIAAEAVEVGQLVRVVQPAADDGDWCGNTAPVIRNNLRRVHWNSYAVNLKGWTNAHNAICNKGASQSLGLTTQTVVLDHILRSFSDATGTHVRQPKPDAGCSVM